MKLTTAMLADAAQVEGGKLFVLGGGFDTIRVQSLPITQRNLTLVLVAEIQPDERHRDLELVVRLIDEDGRFLEVEARGELRVGAPPDLAPGATNNVPIVTAFPAVELAEAKGYAFTVTFEDEEIARIRFRVVQAT